MNRAKFQKALWGLVFLKIRSMTKGHDLNPENPWPKRKSLCKPAPGWGSCISTGFCSRTCIDLQLFSKSGLWLWELIDLRAAKQIITLREKTSHSNPELEAGNGHFHLDLTPSFGDGRKRWLLCTDFPRGCSQEKKEGASLTENNSAFKTAIGL